MNTAKKKQEVPPAMRVQLSRLFGANSKLATAELRSDADWKRDLRLVLGEIRNYLDANVETDSVHRKMLETGFLASSVALSQEEFWPAYTEGITRILLCLLGDYPDHRKRKTGAKNEDYYKLRNDRSITFIQTNKQKEHMLFWSALAFFELQSKPFEALHEFRSELGFKVPITEFLNWYKQKYPEDYLKIF